MKMSSNIKYLTITRLSYRWWLVFIAAWVKNKLDHTRFGLAYTSHFLTHSYIHTDYYRYIYIYIYVCVCVCLCVPPLFPSVISAAQSGFLGDKSHTSHVNSMLSLHIVVQPRLITQSPSREAIHNCSHDQGVWAYAIRRSTVPSAYGRVHPNSHSLGHNITLYHLKVDIRQVCCMLAAAAVDPPLQQRHTPSQH